LEIGTSAAFIPTAPNTVSKPSENTIFSRQVISLSEESFVAILGRKTILIRCHKYFE
jgi:hypothetical protein